MAETDEPLHTPEAVDLINPAPNLPSFKDDLRIRLNAPKGTPHMDIAHTLIGQVNWKVTWTIGNPDENGIFEVTARGWGIRDLVEEALSKTGGKILPPKPPIQSGDGPHFHHNNSPRADSIVRVGDKPWAS